MALGSSGRPGTWLVATIVPSFSLTIAQVIVLVARPAALTSPALAYVTAIVLLLISYALKTG